jgi:hypothetical protein
MLMVDMLDRSGLRLLRVRNPWSKGGIPKSSFSMDELRVSLPSDEDKDLLIGNTSIGTFWVDYATLFQTFKTLYLNWNPAVFQYYSQKHFSFTPSGSDFDVGTNGQYTISVEGTGDAWILIERHYLGKSEGWGGYIGLAMFPGNERVYSYSRPIHRVIPVHVLINNRPNMSMQIIHYLKFLGYLRIRRAQFLSLRMIGILLCPNRLDSSL